MARAKAASSGPSTVPSLSPAERDHGRLAALEQIFHELVHPDNGYCNQCHGHWHYRTDGTWRYEEGEHHPECIGLRLTTLASSIARPATTGEAGTPDATAVDLKRLLAPLHGMGCTDGGCVIERPRGMHTNGGCKCLAPLALPLRGRLTSVLYALQVFAAGSRRALPGRAR